MSELENKKRELLTPLLFEAGAALMDCQRFEYGIALFLFHAGRVGIGKIDPEQVEKILSDNEKKTAGQLLQMLKANIDINSKNEAIFKEALACRNKLIHRVFVNKAEKIVSETGRADLIKEIRDFRRNVNKGDDILGPLNLELSELLDGFDFETKKNEVIKTVLNTN